MADVFISYSKQHPEVTRNLAAELEREGLTVWWDTELVAGESFRSRIQQEIAASKAAIVIWTPSSVNSEYVISEASRASEARKLIQCRTAEVAIKDLPSPFDVSHVPLVDDRKAIIGALRRHGLLGGVASSAGPQSDSWGRRIAPGSVPSWGAPAIVLAVILAAGLFVLWPKSTTVTAVTPASRADVVANEFLKQLNGGLQDATLFDTDVRLGSGYGVKDRVAAVSEIRRHLQQHAKVDCKRDGTGIESRDAEATKAKFRFKIPLVCDFTGRDGKLVSRRFPLEIEAARQGPGLLISGLWHTEEWVLWPRAGGGGGGKGR